MLEYARIRVTSRTSQAKSFNGIRHRVPRLSAYLNYAFRVFVYFSQHQIHLTYHTEISSKNLLCLFLKFINACFVNNHYPIFQISTYFNISCWTLFQKMPALFLIFLIFPIFHLENVFIEDKICRYLQKELFDDNSQLIFLKTSCQVRYSEINTWV